MSVKSIIKDIFKIGGSVIDIRKEVNKSLDDAEARLNRFLHNAMRGMIIAFMCFLGGIFVLVGLSKHLETLAAFGPGIGYLVVGAVLFLLAVFALVMQKE